MLWGLLALVACSSNVGEVTSDPIADIVPSPVPAELIEPHLTPALDVHPPTELSFTVSWQCSDNDAPTLVATAPWGDEHIAVELPQEATSGMLLQLGGHRARVVGGDTMPSAVSVRTLTPTQVDVDLQLVLPDGRSGIGTVGPSTLDPDAGCELP